MPLFADSPVPVFTFVFFSFSFRLLFLPPPSLPSPFSHGRMQIVVWWRYAVKCFMRRCLLNHQIYSWKDWRIPQHLTISVQVKFPSKKYNPQHSKRQVAVASCIKSAFAGALARQSSSPSSSIIGKREGSWCCLGCLFRNKHSTHQP